MVNNFSYIKQIINIFILFETINLINSSKYFKSYKLISGDLLIINSSGFLLQNKITKEISKIGSFNESITFGSVKSLQDIAISQFSLEKNGVIICYIKNYLYVISNDYKKICTNSFKLSSDHPVIITYDIKNENNNINYYYIICFLSNNLINIYEYYYNIDNCNNTLKNYNSVKPTNSKNVETDIEISGSKFDCELMYNDIITCFGRNNNPTEISSTSFDLKNNLTKIIEYCSTENANGASIIRSTISENNKKALMCFYDNNVYSYCNGYDLISNKFTEKISIFNNSITQNTESLKVKYIKETKEYIIFNAMGDTSIDVLKLDENYNIKGNINEYNIKESLKEDGCLILYSYDIYYSDINNSYYIITGCKDNKFINQEISNEYNNFYNESLENNTKEDDKKDNIKCNNLIYNGICLKENDTCPNDFPYYYIKTNICTNNCSLNNMIENICQISFINDEIFNNILSNYKDLLFKTNNTILLYNNTIIDSEKLKFQITDNNQQKILIEQINQNNIYDNLSTIDFGECGKKLKQKYNIDYFLVIKIDIINITEDGTKLTDVEYELYHPITKEKLNLSICENESIYIYLPYYASDEEKSKLENSINQGYDILNSENSFYTDICTPFTTENNKDIILSDRRNNYYDKNMSEWCGNGCTYNEYSSNNKVKCECLTKLNIFESMNDIKSVINNLEQNFLDFKTYSNIKIIYCYKLVFSKNGLKSNIGSYIILILIFCCIILTIIFIQDKNRKLKYLIYDKIYIKINKNLNSPPKTKCTKLINESSSKKINKSLNNSKISDSLQNCKKLKIPGKANINIYKNNKKKTNQIVFQNNFIILDSQNNDKSNTKFILNKEKYKNDKKKTINQNDKNRVEIFKRGKDNKKVPLNLDNIYFNDEELNSMKYEEAIKYDKRTYFQFYWALLKKKQLILFTFVSKNDYNIFILKIILFILSISLYFTVNALFFDDDTMHNIYETSTNKSILTQIPKIIYSTLISSVINKIIKILCLPEREILKLRKIKNKREVMISSLNVIKCIKIQSLIFFIITYILMLIFWYYLSAFCAVYKNTGKILIINSLISFFLSMSYPFGLNLIPGLFRIPALKDKRKSKSCIYLISSLLSLI